MSSKKKLSLKEKIRRGGPTDLVPVWFGAPMELVREYEQANKELEEARNSGDATDSLAGSPVVDEEQARVEALREQLSEYVVWFRLRGLDSKRWERMVDKHPPRKDAEGNVDERDKLGWNASTFPGDLLRATVIDPELDEDDWIAMLGDGELPGSLSDGQLDILAGKAYRLSQNSVDVPFWSAASPTTRN